MHKWVVCDLDGTLLKHSGNELVASKQTVNIINSLKENGVRFTFATGRHYLNALHLLKNEKINLENDDYIVGLNGTQIYSMKQEKLIFEQTLKNDQILVINNIIPLLEQKYNNQYLIIFYGLNNEIIFLNNKGTNFKQLVDNTINFHGSDINDFNIKYVDSISEVGDVFKCTIYINDEKFEYELLKKELEKLSNKYDVTKSLKYLLELMPKNINKAISLEYLNQNYYNFDKHDIIAFGDSQNDLEMFKFAGTSVTRSTGDEKLKDIASYVIDAEPSDFVGDGLELLVN